MMYTALALAAGLAFWTALLLVAFSAYGWAVLAGIVTVALFSVLLER